MRARTKTYANLYKNVGHEVIRAAHENRACTPRSSRSSGAWCSLQQHVKGKGTIRCKGDLKGGDRKEVFGDRRATIGRQTVYSTSTHLSSSPATPAAATADSPWQWHHRCTDGQWRLVSHRVHET